MYISSSRTALKFLRMACGALFLVLWMPNLARAAFPQEKGKTEVRLTPELRKQIEQTIPELSYLPPSERERVLKRVEEIFQAGDAGVEKESKQPGAVSPDDLDSGQAGLYSEPADRRSPDYVRWVQESLNALGMNLNTDGKFTREVREGVREFQKRNGLTPVGIVGPRTERKLVEQTNTSPPRNWSFPYLRERVAPPQEAPPQLERKTVFLDVSNSNGRISVTARSAGDFWLQEAGLMELGKGTKQDVSSIDELERVIGDAKRVVQEGEELPREWRDRLQDKVYYLRKSRLSPNIGLGEYEKAVELGKQPLSVANTKIFNALPYEQDLASSLRELWRMDLNLGQSKEWRNLDSQLSSSAERNQLPMVRASKTEVFKELQSGNSNLVFVMAHSSGEIMYFPGRTGESSSFKEASGLKREDTPERVFVLVMCKGGTVNSENASLAEVLLQNGLARTVFASQEDVDARLVPKLLQEILLKGVAIRETLKKYGFHQIAGLIRLHTDALAA